MNVKEDFSITKHGSPSQANSQFCMNLPIRERAVLVLDKRVCWIRSVFEDVNDWTDCKNELMCYFVKHYIQTKAHEGKKKEHLIQIIRVKNM